MKKILLICAVAVTVTLLCVGFANDTLYKQASFCDNEQNFNVEITIIRNNFNKLFKNIKSDISVKGENVDYTYEVPGQIFKMEGYYAVPVYRKDEVGLASQGYIYYDENMENVVIETTQEKIYSASDEFIEMVIK